MSVTTLDRCQVGGQLIIDMCWGGAHWALDPREVILKSQTRLSSIESQPKKVVVVVVVVYCCSLCRYCYHFKFSQNWVSSS